MFFATYFVVPETGCPGNALTCKLDLDCKRTILIASAPLEKASGNASATLSHLTWRCLAQRSRRQKSPPPPTEHAL
eukprot:g35487.t1